MLKGESLTAESDESLNAKLRHVFCRHEALPTHRLS